MILRCYTNVIRHFVPGGEHTYQLPYTTTLRCGCQVTI